MHVRGPIPHGIRRSGKKEWTDKHASEKKKKETVIGVYTALFGYPV